jgi:hypothetical protein
MLSNEQQTGTHLEGNHTMRDFSWKYFTLTGDVESYLLYREVNDGGDEEQEESELLPDELEG